MDHAALSTPLLEVSRLASGRKSGSGSTLATSDFGQNQGAFESAIPRMRTAVGRQDPATCQRERLRWARENGEPIR
jgi:hypothetical protein